MNNQKKLKLKIEIYMYLYIMIFHVIHLDLFDLFLSCF